VAGKMYSNLYQKVMKAKNPRENSNRMDQAAGSNTFDVFKAGWNQMQDKYDKSY
jgi:uncharacterized glyoxalase superfamily metalloenzyme YdcJ